jgi:hypothetical protein
MTDVVADATAVDVTVVDAAAISDAKLNGFPVEDSLAAIKLLICVTLTTGVLLLLGNTL